MSNLPHNAIESINVGLEDYEKPGRIQSSLRNVHAGILLLFKEKLLRISPSGSNEVLIKARIVPKLDASGSVTFVGDGTNTVDIKQIQDRFKALNIKADWKRFDAVTNLRNNVEHYYSDVPPSTMKEVLANSFIIIRDFIVTELGQDPRDLLGEGKWKVLLSVSEVFEQERAECVEALRAIDWDSQTLSEAVLNHKCAKCESSLVQPVSATADFQDVEFRCKACDDRQKFEDSVEKILEHYLWREIYLSHTDGDRPPLERCDECNREAFVADEEKCVACGSELCYRNCNICGNELGPDEQSNHGLCHYHAHLAVENERNCRDAGFPIEPDFDTGEPIEF
jgi:hypothetical protein